MAMRRTILSLLAGVVIGGAATGAILAQAQPPGPPGAGGPPWGPGPHAGWMMPHGPGMPGGPGGPGGGPGPGMMRTFALVYPQADRNLSSQDVQKIAEAFLLWHGNHTWKVIEVAPAADGTIGFALATQEGSVIARFTIDPHTGHVTRTA
jgi:hypothetical protein